MSTLMHPVTGEVIDLVDLPNDVLIETAAQMRELGALVKQARADLDGEIDRRRSPSSRVFAGDVWVAERTVTRSWDARSIVGALQRLVETGVIAPGDAEQYVPEVASRKPDGRALNALVTRLTDAGDLEAARIVLAARRESARYQYQEVPA